jgi:hypothetical protein
MIHRSQLAAGHYEERKQGLVANLSGIVHAGWRFSTMKDEKREMRRG